MSRERDILATNAIPTPSPVENLLSGCYERSWAVVVGINAYRSVDKLDYARADAEAVAMALGEIGFSAENTFTLLDDAATRQNIQDLLSVELARKTGPNDRVLVFFAGHGQDFTSPSGKKLGFLVPVDGDPNYLASRCISMADVDSWSDLIPAKHILFVMDCCYSGLAATRRTGLSVEHGSYLAEITRRPVRQIITAGRAEEKVIEDSGQGVFTRVLLRGLRGEADLTGRGFVTGLDLGHYLESRVYEESRWRQRPLFRYLSGDGEFLVVRGVPLVEPRPPQIGLRPEHQVDDIDQLKKLREDIERHIDECLRVIHQGSDPISYLERADSSRLSDWQQAAELGWPEGQWLMGQRLEDGVGCDRDPVAAACWYRKAAEQDYALGQVCLGRLYCDGLGVEQDHKEAVRWYRKAAEQGLAGAQYDLGVCYANGEGVARDAAEAVRWYRKAAEQEQPDAIAALRRYDAEGDTRPQIDLKEQLAVMEAFFPMTVEQAQEVQAAATGVLGIPVEITNSIGMTLRLIPAGEFLMGSPESEEYCGIDGGPQHRVRITTPFYLGVYEVTQEEYKRVMGTNPSHFQGSPGFMALFAGPHEPTQPVERVSWDEADAFCRKVSETLRGALNGYVCRLPTEAEWEYACRAGMATRYSSGDDETTLGDYAWFDENSDGTTHPVGRKIPNAWGLYDMHGNVWEWCADWYGEEYYANSPVEDPQGPATGSLRVFRGGGWCYGANYCRSATRHGFLPDGRCFYLGFRLALVPADE